MKLTKSQLKQIIKEELNELFGFGRKKKPEPEPGPEPIPETDPSDLSCAELEARHSAAIRRRHASRGAYRDIDPDSAAEVRVKSSLEDGLNAKCPWAIDIKRREAEQREYSTRKREI